MQTIPLGKEVTYRTADGKDATGTVHGVSTSETADGEQFVLGYQIDTGRDDRVDEFPVDKRGQAINEQATELVEKEGISYQEALAKVVERDKNLPDEGITVEKVRHPELVIVPASLVTRV